MDPQACKYAPAVAESAFVCPAGTRPKDVQIPGTTAEECCLTNEPSPSASGAMQVGAPALALALALLAAAVL